MKDINMFKESILMFAVMSMCLYGCDNIPPKDHTEGNIRIIESLGTMEEISRIINRTEKEGWVLVSESKGRCVFKKPNQPIGDKNVQ